MLVLESQDPQTLQMLAQSVADQSGAVRTSSASGFVSLSEKLGF